MKKSTALFAMALTAMVGATSFASCNLMQGQQEGAEQKTVMNVSLNPQVEFVLDKDNKVLSVNALNEEGNLVISAAAFENVEGKTAEEAANLFVQVSKETGYLVEGGAELGDNKIDISISGDTKQAETLFNSVKTKVDEYLTQENVTAQIAQAAAITEEQLKALVEECAPYVETAQMEYAELVDTLVESRKETAEFYSQELKNAYYEAKAFAMEQAELETLKTHLNSVQQIVFDGMSSAYTMAVDMIESTRMTVLVNEDSIYQLALKAFREAKIDYLHYRKQIVTENVEIDVQVTANLENLQTLVDNAEAALIKAGEDANATLDNLKTAVTENYNKLVALLEEQAVKANEHLEEISVKQKEKQTAFFTQFESTYAQAITAAENNWAAMKTELEKQAAGNSDAE